jgi:CBS domain-containing membrane protein
MSSDEQGSTEAKGADAGDGSKKGSNGEPPAEEQKQTAPSAAKDAAPEHAAAPAADAEKPSDEEPPDSAIEVEPVSFRPKAPARAAGEHPLPPPPPSTRIKGGTSKLEVGKDPKLARDLMTKKIFTIGPKDIIEHLEEHMQAFRFRHLPVVEGKKLVGLITHSDLLHASSSFLSDRAVERDALIHKQPAKRIMQTELITVRPTDTLAEVALLMWEGRIGCVLVTEEDQTLVGIITEGDFIRLAHHFLTEKR